MLLTQAYIQVKWKKKLHDLERRMPKFYFAKYYEFIHFITRPLLTYFEIYDNYRRV